MKEPDAEKSAQSAKEFTYPLPDSSSETKRLIQQSAFINPFTRSLFVEAGIAPNMIVLDVGSGAGDVALLAADLIGPEGRVVGIDRNGAGLEIARARASSAGFSHVVFREGNLADIDSDEKFDAVVGRLVLMYQPDPAATLRHLASLLKPRGIVAFGAYAAATVRSLLPLILKAGLASADEIGIDTLEERLRSEVVAANGFIRLPELINAWARAPGTTAPMRGNGRH